MGRCSRSLCARESLVFGSRPWREGRDDGASIPVLDWRRRRQLFLLSPQHSVYVSENSMPRHLSGLYSAVQMAYIYIYEGVWFLVLAKVRIDAYPLRSFTCVFRIPTRGLQVP